MTVAVVTGAALGIGRATASRLADNGATVVGVDINEQALSQAADELGPRMVPVAGDIAELETHEAAARKAAAIGELKWWVNNAGVDAQGSAHEISEEHVDRYMRILLSGPMFGMSVAVRQFLRSQGGAIVNVSSIQGMYAFPGAFVYQAAKAGVLAATRSVAVDYAKHGIRCNAVLPGTIATPMTMADREPGEDVDGFLRRHGELSPMGRVGDAEEVATVIAFLLSDESSYINGAGVPVDGGTIARCFAYPDVGDPLT